MAFIGIDMGGSTVRCVVVHEDGSPASMTTAGAGNFRSGGAAVGEHVARAVSDALTSAAVDPRAIESIVVGAAGAAEAGGAQTRELLDEALTPLGLPSAEVLEDLVIAFRSGSPSPDGFLLLAGTGAVAARFEGWRRTERSDGMGWLLGDAGSGLWLGRKVLRAAAADLDGRGPTTSLTTAVLEQLGLPSDGDQRQPMIRAATPLTPSQWAGFAPLAFTFDGDDAVATSLLDEATAHLVRSAEAVGARQEVVFAGGLLAQEGLRRRLAGRFDGPHASMPVVGACAEAADRIGIQLDRAALTRRITDLAR